MNKVQIVRNIDDGYYTYMNGVLISCSEDIPWERICRISGIVIEDYYTECDYGSDPPDRLENISKPVAYVKVNKDGIVYALGRR